jgi:HEAT repeat protein
MGEWTKKALIQSLGSASPEVRNQALETLIGQGPPTDESLLAALASDQRSVRLGAMEVLGLLGEERAVEGLIEALRDPDEHVRWHAAFALEWIGSPRAIGPLAEVLREDHDRDVQRAAAQALAQIGPPAVPSLLEALRQETGPEFSGERFQYEEWKSQQILRWARRLAAKALGQIGDPRAVEPLIEAHFTGAPEDFSLGLDTAAALWSLGGPAAQDALGQAAQEGSWGALFQLSLKRDKRALPPLLRYLRHEDKGQQAEAAEYLGYLGDPDAVGPLISALRDEDVHVRGCAAQALAFLEALNPEDDRAAGPLLEALRDEDSTTRELAADALGWIQGPRVLSALHDLFQQEADPEVRLLAAGALGRKGDLRGFDLAVQGLQDSRWQVRVCAVYALGLMKDQRAVEPLIQALQDENEDVKSKAVQALGKLGGRRATEAVISALGDPEVIFRACRELRWMGEPWAIPAVERWCEAESLSGFQHFIHQVLYDLKRKRAAQWVGDREGLSPAEVRS